MNFQNKKITVMGLGLNGGGSASARFFAEAGADVTVTDLRNEEILKPSIDELSDLNIRYVLGEHSEADFRNADVVIKNPAVRPDSPYLAAAAEGGASIETDISVFLQHNRRPVIAVTGSKGKSTTVSAAYHVLKKSIPGTDLGGNITVSPLTFFSEEKNESNAPVLLELSSWQLADIAGRGLLNPVAAAITNIMHDHQDRYNSMDRYAADKAVIFESQSPGNILLLNASSLYTESFSLSARSKIVYLFSEPDKREAVQCGVWLDESGRGYWNVTGKTEQILNSTNMLKGRHNRINLLTAAALLCAFGLDPEPVRNGLSEFPGIAHRLEFVAEAAGLKWYNDSAATIPEAAAAAISSFDAPLHLITGGTDKQLDFSPLADAAEGKNCPAPPVSITLLEGTGTDKIIKLLRKRGINYNGPFGSLSEAIEKVVSIAGGAGAADGASVVLTPGCSSFGMFRNEFDRGNRFKEIVRSLG